MSQSRWQTHPAHWPLLPRLALCLLALLVCAGSGLLLAVNELDEVRRSARQRQQDLRVQYQAALTQQAQLPALQSRQRTLAVQLAAQQGQLWPADQLQPELLQAKLARRASECGLTLSSFKPLSGRLAAAIVLRGSHSGLLRFVELVSSLPLPVMFERLDVNVVEKDGQSELQMNASVSAPVTASLSGIGTKETAP
ncbi:type 4a pilus biogenesis protein PilO [Herbaspirillum huttiense]|uniref:type 4a pilus biogenesis protein PilO n=1 Tax=Herbaspirillum huttiense TaxID=863372 RepID=UPI0039AFEE36